MTTNEKATPNLQSGIDRNNRIRESLIDAVKTRAEMDSAYRTKLEQKIGKLEEKSEPEPEIKVDDDNGSDDQ